jgi:hypothetical protein
MNLKEIAEFVEGVGIYICLFVVFISPFVLLIICSMMYSGAVSVF